MSTAGDAASPPFPGPGAWDRILVCVVSDHAWAGDLVRQACDPDEHEVRQVSRDAQAFMRTSRLAPSVIAVDVAGGDAAPFDLLRALQDSPETHAIPTIALAAAPDTLVRAAAFAAGVEDFAHRGTDPDELQSRLRTLMRLGAASRRALDSESTLARLQQRVRERDRELEALQRQVREMRESLHHDNRTQRGRVDAMVQVGLELNRVQDFHVLMDRILSEARRLIHADAGTIYIREGRTLRFAYAQNDTFASRGGESPRFGGFMVPASETSVAGWVASSGEPVNLADAYDVPPERPYRFDPTFDQLTGYRTRSVLTLPLRSSTGRTLGVLQLLNAVDERGRPRERFTEGDVTLLGHFASMATVAIERSDFMKTMIQRMLQLNAAHDPMETLPHVQRVEAISALLFEGWARRRGLDGPAYERQRDRLRAAAQVHDLGKVGISDAVLKKPAALDDAERALVRQHVLIGARLFAEHPNEYDEAARDVVLNHHERWDGGGYPGHVDPMTGARISDPVTGHTRAGGKQGEEIPLFARIVALADVFDALSSERCYKAAWPERRVLDTIRSESGRHFDPELVEIFFERLDEVREIRTSNPG